jgi:hypothetical protein
MICFYSKDMISELLDFENDHPFKKLVFDKIRIQSDTYRRVDIFADVNTLRRPIIKTPILYSPYDINEHDNGNKTLTLSLTPLIGKRKLFFDFFKKLDKLIVKILKPKLDKTYEFKSTIKKKSGTRYPFRLIVELPKNKAGNNLYEIYNTNKQKQEQLESPCNIEAVIDVAGIWIGEKDYGCSLSLIILKVHLPIVYRQLLFDDTLDEVVVKKDSEEQPKIPDAPPLDEEIVVYEKPSKRGFEEPKSNKKSDKRKSEKKPTTKRNESYAPNLDELLAMRRKLKKTKTIVKTLELGKVVKKIKKNKKK